MTEPLPKPVPPGGVVYLLQMSTLEQGPEPARAATARFIDAILDQLLELWAGGSLPESFTVTILGYGAPLDGAAGFYHLVGERGGVFSRPVAELAGLAPPQRQEGLARWVCAETWANRLSPAEALRFAHWVTEGWSRRQPEGTPLLIVHCHNGHGLDEQYERISRSLRLLAPPTGRILLLDCIYPEEMAGPQPAQAEDNGLFVNGWPVAVFRQLLQGEPPSRPIEGETAAAVFREHRLWVPREGNADEEWEDACAVAPERALAAVADGAGEGIFSRRWANSLVAEFVDRRPELSDPAARAAWLEVCRKQWHKEIDLPRLRWSQQAKVLSTGAAATFLALRCGCADGRGEVPWEAWAVGDSCLFWVRDNRLRASFPIFHSGQLTSAPALLRTKVVGPDPEPQRAAGVCRVGDAFVLTTDAVAGMLLRACEAGTPPDWNRFEALEQPDWRSEIVQEREAGQIVNDDCTLVFLRVDRHLASPAQDSGDTLNEAGPL